MASTILFQRQRLAIASTADRFVLPPLVILPQTSQIELRIARPTTANPKAWGNADRFKVAIIVEFDGEEYRCDGQTTGGIRVIESKDREGEAAEYVLKYGVPWGFFDVKEGFPIRLGERSKISYRTRVEITSLDGSIDSDIIVLGRDDPAPALAFHSSVAFGVASSVIESIGDGTVSVSHTAGAGSDRAAFVASGVEGAVANPTGFTHTYGGVAPSGNIWSAQGQNTSQWNKGDYFLEANVPTTAQTVQSVVTTSPATNDHGMGVITMTGVHQTTPVGTPGSHKAASGTTPSVTVGSVGADDLVVDAIFGYAQTGGLTAGASQTDRWAQQSGSACFSGSTQLGSNGGVMSWTKSSNFEFRTDAVAFKPAAAGGDGAASTAGTSSAQGATAAIAAAQASSLGVAVTTAVGASLSDALAQSDGTSDAQAEGAAQVASDADSQGIADAQAQGEEVQANIAAGAASAIGQADAQAEGASDAEAAALSEGTADAQAVGEDATPGAASTVITLGARNRWREERRRREQLEREEEEDFAALVRFATQHIAHEHLRNQRGARA